eukprot:jgi/Pico_ML_1/51898/g362.t1
MLPQKSFLIFFGVVSTTMSKSLGFRFNSKSRTVPPTKYAVWPAFLIRFINPMIAFGISDDLTPCTSTGSALSPGTCIRGTSAGIGFARCSPRPGSKDMARGAYRTLLFAALVALLVSLVAGAVMPDDLVGVREYVPDAESRGPWPDLVGKTSVEAKEFLEKSFPDLKVIVLNENSMMTMDYRVDRVRIMVNEEGVVTKVPHRG